MFLRLVYVAAWLITSAAADKPYYDLENADTLFQEFIQNHGKIYQNDADKQQRFEIFVKNVEEINRLNSVSEVVRAINKFADLAPEEFTSRYLGHRPNVQRSGLSCKTIITDEDIVTKDAPASLDFRRQGIVTPVKNQDICGSCWTFGATGTMEGQYAMKHKHLVSLSEQHILDCVDLDGCDGNGHIFAINEMTDTYGGILLESQYPYVGKQLVCPIINPMTIKVKLDGCINFLLTDEEKLKEALYQYGPMAVAVSADTWQLFHRDIYNVTDCPEEPVNHTVLLVGYGTLGGKDYWLIKNSWGTDVGDEGYYKIARGQNACGILNSEIAVAVVL